MSTLFDVSPYEPVRNRKQGKKSAHADSAPVQTQIEPTYKPFIEARAIKALGRLDQTHECADSMCRGSAHDIIHEDRGEWLIQCCFCNTAQWVPVIAGHLKPKEEEFIFRGGRFPGMSIDEVADLPGGRKYIENAAELHDRPAVRAACKTWLARFAPTV